MPMAFGLPFQQNNSGIAVDPRWGDLGKTTTGTASQWQAKWNSLDDWSKSLPENQWMNGGGGQIPYGAPGSGPGGVGQLGGGLFGMGGAGGMSASWSGGNPFATDAQAAKLKGEYDKLRAQSKGRINEDLASRGIFSSGVGANLMSQEMGSLDLSQAAALEELYNRASQQQLSFQMEMMRNQQQMAGRGGFGGPGGMGQTFVGHSPGFGGGVSFGPPQYGGGGPSADPYAGFVEPP